MGVITIISENRINRIPLHHRRPRNPAAQVILREGGVTGYAGTVVGRQRHVPAAVGTAVRKDGVLQQGLKRLGGFRRRDLPGLRHPALPVVAGIAVLVAGRLFGVLGQAQLPRPVILETAPAPVRTLLPHQLVAAVVAVARFQPVIRMDGRAVLHRGDLSLTQRLHTCRRYRLHQVPGLVVVVQGIVILFGNIGIGKGLRRQVQAVPLKVGIVLPYPALHHGCRRQLPQRGCPRRPVRLAGVQYRLPVGGEHKDTVKFRQQINATFVTHL